MIINKNIFKNPNVGAPNFFEDEHFLDWSMTRNERYCLSKMLEKIKPKITIEIGTYNGGSLQVLSKYSETVYAIDIDINVKERLKNKFDNVIFLIGDSKLIIPKLIKELQKKNESIEFALIDGDHSEMGVKADIENLIKYVPVNSLNIILHDSFNPNCRKGMKAVNYNENKYIHYVELDFITGVFEPNGLKKEMWGGFSHIVLLNEKREGEIQVYESQKRIYDIIYYRSKHFKRNVHHIIKHFLRKKLFFLKPIVKFF